MYIIESTRKWQHTAAEYCYTAGLCRFIYIIIPAVLIINCILSYRKSLRLFLADKIIFVDTSPPMWIER
jgi:hypothetical protein